VARLKPEVGLRDRALRSGRNEQPVAEGIGQRRAELALEKRKNRIVREGRAVRRAEKRGDIEELAEGGTSNRCDNIKKFLVNSAVVAERASTA
jgi:hypothetical protein